MAVKPKAMDAATLTQVAMYTISARRAENVRFSEIYEYFKNRIIDIYIPKRHTPEFRQLVDQSRWNILPTLESALANKLFIEGYRTGKSAKNSPIWDEAWQPNRMDARQAGLWHAALRYGMSYATVLPGQLADKKIPVITPWSPRRLTALYKDPINDEWPLYFMTVGIPYPRFESGQTVMVTPVEIYDGNFRYRFTLPATILQMPIFGQNANVATPLMEAVTVDANQVEIAEHGLGVPPAVRFLQSHGDLDDGPEGILFPMLPAQRSLNQTTFNVKMGEQFAIFRQRFVTGMAIEEDKDGVPINPFSVGMDLMLQADSPDTKFGEFEQTSIDDYLKSRDKQLLYVASARSLPPQTLVVGDTVSNVNAEALAMLQGEHTQDIAATKTSLGEGGEQTMRLCGLASGDTDAWKDTSAQVRWRDTTPRSLAQIADALGKFAQMLGVPARGLWERIPDVTDQDLAQWEQLAKESDSFAKLEGLMNGANSRRAPADPGAPAAIGSAVN